MDLGIVFINDTEPITYLRTKNHWTLNLEVFLLLSVIQTYPQPQSLSPWALPTKHERDKAPEENPLGTSEVWDYLWSS